MASRRATAGTVIGAVIIALGVASLVLNLGLREFNIDDTYAQGAVVPPYTLAAPEGTVQSLVISGDSFEVTLNTPERGVEVARHTGTHTQEWTHGSSGRSVLEIVSGDEISVRGTLYSETEWVFITYDAFVIITGLIVIGFSAGFGKRRPRGF